MLAKTYNGNGKVLRHHYTIVELLVVIVIMAILMGIGVGGLNGVLGRQGPTGAVRTLAGQLTMARSYAVSHNRYVAVLFPDSNKSSNPSSGETQTLSGDEKDYPYSRTRLCYVTYDSNTDKFTFNSWIDGQPWEKLPSKTAAYVRTGAVKIIDVDFDGTDYDIAGMVYKPSGTLHGSTEVIVKVLRAVYDINNDEVVYQEGEAEDEGWDITINGFTGRASYEKIP